MSVPVIMLFKQYGYIGGAMGTYTTWCLTLVVNDEHMWGCCLGKPTIKDPKVPIDQSIPSLACQNDTRHRPTQTMNDPSQAKRHKRSFHERHRAASHERPNAGYTTHDVVPWVTQVRPSDTGRRPINDPMQAKRHKTSSHERPKSGQATQGAVPWATQCRPSDTRHRPMKVSSQAKRHKAWKRNDNHREGTKHRQVLSAHTLLEPY